MIVNKKRQMFLSDTEIRGMLYSKGKQFLLQRLAKPQPRSNPSFYGGHSIEIRKAEYAVHSLNLGRGSYGYKTVCPYGTVGDVLWEKECWKIASAAEEEISYRADNSVVRYLNSPNAFWIGKSEDTKWRSPVTMPQWASRITMLITDLKLKPVQDVTPAEAKIMGFELEQSLEEYSSWWDHTHAKSGFVFSTNPWVWSIEVEVI